MNQYVCECEYEYECLEKREIYYNKDDLNQLSHIYLITINNEEQQEDGTG